MQDRSAMGLMLSHRMLQAQKKHNSLESIPKKCYHQNAVETYPLIWPYFFQIKYMIWQILQYII